MHLHNSHFCRIRAPADDYSLFSNLFKRLELNEKLQYCAIKPFFNDLLPPFNDLFSHFKLLFAGLFLFSPII